MEEDFGSWVTRAKFSQAVYHRWDSSRSPAVCDFDWGLKPNSSSLGLKNRSSSLELKSQSSSIELKNRSSSLDLKPKSSSSDLTSSAIPSSAQLNSDQGLKPKVSVLEHSNAPLVQFSFLPDNDPVLKVKSFSSGLSVLSNPSRVQLDRSWGPKTMNTSLESANFLSVPFSFQPGSNPSKLQPKGSDLHSSDFSFRPDRKPDSNPKSSASGKVSKSSWRAITNYESPKSSLFTNGRKQKSKPKQRSSSPPPTTILSDVFKEARSITKRFSSPPPSRKNSNKLGFNMNLLSVTYGGIMATGVTFYLQSWTIEKKGPVFLAMGSPLILIIQIICSYVLLGEIINLGSILSGVLMVGGLYGVLWGKKREENDRKKQIRENEKACLEEKETAIPAQGVLV